MDRKQIFVAVALACASVAAQAETATPIKHLIVVIGENRTFDNLYATYQPLRGQAISNLLSRGIINKDGSPGKNFSIAAQKRAAYTDRFEIELAATGAYETLPPPNSYGAYGQPRPADDPRFPAKLPNGPFQISKYVHPGAHVGDPIHRFYQMWQQYDGGKMDMMVWVADTAATGSNNDNTHTLQPKPPRQGGVSMGFYNMAEGDAPYFRKLADNYALADNYHQSIMGGTGANFIAIASGDMGSYNVDGAVAVPPQNQIENPDPQPGTNWYKQDGYSGGSYSNCADLEQPGVAAIRNYLAKLPYRAFNNGNCAADTYYLLNNYEPGYKANGELQPLGSDKFTLPPQYAPTIAENLSSHQVSWKWYAGGRGNGNAPDKEYCTICDPFTFYKGVMTGPLKDNLVDLSKFYGDVSSGALPAVSFVSPYDSISGHPGYSTLTLFSDMLEGIVNHVQKNKALWQDTAIIVTFDEGGGYYDSGYIQPIDFFGDGPRVPLLLISPHAKPGHVDHTYYDHASILKFIEKNWHLPPLSTRSRDALPNPVHGKDAYVPQNRPAIGDLTNLLKGYK